MNDETHRAKAVLRRAGYLIPDSPADPREMELEAWRLEVEGIVSTAFADRPGVSWELFVMPLDPHCYRDQHRHLRVTLWHETLLTDSVWGTIVAVRGYGNQGRLPAEVFARAIIARMRKLLSGEWPSGYDMFEHMGSGSRYPAVMLSREECGFLKGVTG